MSWPAEEAPDHEPVHTEAVEARDYEPAHALAGPVVPVSDTVLPVEQSGAGLVLPVEQSAGDLVLPVGQAAAGLVPPVEQPVAGPVGADWTPAPVPLRHAAAYQAWTPPAHTWTPPGLHDPLHLVAGTPPEYTWTPQPWAPPTQGQPPPTAPIWPGPTDEERVWAPAAHWLPLLTHWIGPLVVLLTVGRRSEWVRAEAAASLNWEITVAVLLALSVALSRFGVIGPALALAVIVLSLGLHIAGAITASRGGSFHYPLALPIVR